MILQLSQFFFNGAQGDIIPIIGTHEDRWEVCQRIGKELAQSVKDIWNQTGTEESVAIQTYQDRYAFVPQATPFGLKLPLDHYDTEINLIVFNGKHGFITIPGELSCVYDHQFKNKKNKWNLSHLSVLGLVNDAHGYIILPEAWRHQTVESRLSFGGECYGEMVVNKVEELLKLSCKPIN